MKRTTKYPAYNVALQWLADHAHADQKCITLISALYGEPEEDVKLAIIRKRIKKEVTK